MHAATMPLWLVKVTWHEDETEAHEQWAVKAGTAIDAVSAVRPHVRFQPHHVEARLCPPATVDEAYGDLQPGQVRRVPPK